MWPFSSSDSPYSTGSQYTSYGPGDPQFEAGFADPGALAAAANAAGKPGTENLDMPSTDWLSKATNPDLVKALQDASKSSVFKQPDNTPLAPAKPLDVSPGRPRLPGSLDALVQLLEKQRAQYGTLSGQPVAQPRQIGLLGF